MEKKKWSGCLKETLNTSRSTVDPHLTRAESCCLLQADTRQHFASLGPNKGANNKDNDD